MPQLAVDISAMVDGKNLDDFLIASRALVASDYLVDAMAMAIPDFNNIDSVILNSTNPSITAVPNTPVVNLTQISISGNNTIQNSSISCF